LKVYVERRRLLVLTMVTPVAPSLNGLKVYVERRRLLVLTMMTPVAPSLNGLKVYGERRRLLVLTMVTPVAPSLNGLKVYDYKALCTINGTVRVFGRNLHSRMPLSSTPLLRLKRAGV
jgi:hypothetical protein